MKSLLDLALFRRLRWFLSGLALASWLAGLVGIVLSRDWRLLLAFPSAFLAIEMRRTIVLTAEPESNLDKPLMPPPLPQITLGGFEAIARTVCLVVLIDFAYASIAHFAAATGTPLWTEVCWFAGLCLWPGHFQWKTARDWMEVGTVFLVMAVCAPILLVVPREADVVVFCAMLATVASLSVFYWRQCRKGETT